MDFFDMCATFDNFCPRQLARRFPPARLCAADNGRGCSSGDTDAPLAAGGRLSGPGP